jgi:enediyne biosynthesis protein E4
MKMRFNSFAFAFLSLALPADADPLFQAIDAPEHAYAGGWEHFVGGGLAAFDCDGDGLPELFAAGGSNPSILLRNQSTSDKVQFVQDTPSALNLTAVTGAYPLDIDSDGHLDLAILRVGKNLILRGGPDCSFSQFSELNFISSDRWTTAFSATWEEGQALPTLAFGNYVDRSDPNGPFRACDVNDLYRPKAGQYGDPQQLSPGHCPLSMLFSDWGRKSRADLRVSNDRHYYVDQGQEQLWAMEQTPRLYDTDDGWQDHRLWGMGIASRDLDHDGLPEVFMSSMGDQRLQRLKNGDDAPFYEDVPFSQGTAAQRPYVGGDGRPSTGWHIAFGDVQNDGRDDIFIAKGNVEHMASAAMDDPNNLLIQNSDGTFTEAGSTAGLASMHRGRGAVLVDLNSDGLLDIAVNNRRAALEIYQNVTTDTGHWLTVGLSQSAPNVNAVGAWIELDDGTHIQSREITVGGGHSGGIAVPEHFGLGKTTDVNIRVLWPDGFVTDWENIPVGQNLLLSR